MKTKFQIYTVPGQVYYNSTRKLVLQGADGVVFVADSKKGKMQENLESLENLTDNLREYGLDINTIPLVLQYNKRDLPEVYTVEEMNQQINRWNAPHFEAVARDGVGVFPTLKHLAGMVLESLNRQQTTPSIPSRVPASVAPGATPEVAPSAPAAAAAVAVATPPRSQPAPLPVAPAASVQPHVARPAMQPHVALPNAAPPQAVPAPAYTTAHSHKKRSSGKGKIVVGVVFLVVAGLAAYLYFSGLWKSLLP